MKNKTNRKNILIRDSLKIFYIKIDSSFLILLFELKTIKKKFKSKLEKFIGKYQLIFVK